MASGNTYTYRGRPDGLLATSTTGDTARVVPEPFYLGLVEDVIVDHFHPDYATDGFNVGAIKVRIFTVDDSKDKDLLGWADPIDTTLQEMPLIGEVVILKKVLSNFFYTRKVNIAHRLQENAMLKMNDVLNKRPSKLKTSLTGNSSRVESEQHKFGQYYKPDSRVRPLKHFEGDVIMQGRMGHSIRFGSSQIDPSSKAMAPNILLRTGQARDVEFKACTSDKIFGLILEDINNDVSSLWMTSDQVIPYEPTIVDAGSFHRSLKNAPNLYNGGSIIINSDRVVLGSKKTHILMYAQEEIYLNSFKNTSIDTDNNIILAANVDIRNMSGRNIDNIADRDYTLSVGNDITIMATKNFSLVADKIFLGSIGNDSEPMVGGISLSKWLARLILTLMGTPTSILPWTTQQTTTVPPPVPGTATAAHTLFPGVLSPDIMGGLIKLYTELVIPNSGQSIPSAFAGAPFNSGDNFVNMGNELPSIQKNNFKSGKTATVKNNSWALPDPYYRAV